jgi:large subunit ribosomal protein L28
VALDSLAHPAVGYPVAVARRARDPVPSLIQLIQLIQESSVAAVCDICAKKPGFGNNRPWSKKITKRRFDPNIQRVRATVNGTRKRLNVCTSCLKAGKVTR